MNAILNRQDEPQWALIAQTLKPCTPKLQLALIEHLGSFRQIFESQESINSSALNQQLQIIRKAYHAGQWQAEVERIGKTLEQYQAQIVPITSQEYPPQLQQIAKPPPLLYVRGNPNCLHLPQIAIVGSRRMTRGAEKIAKSWAKSLAASGFTITSGMAIGIDSCAHRGALEAPQGISVGVVATGIDRSYPSRNASLAEQIVEKGGVLITEFAPGTPPLPAHFPQRNRIISGLSLGVLVVEAALKSGSLITAKYALEQNREVFAIPGSINSPQSKGCHQLIKQGACLVETTAELVEEIAGPLASYGEKYKDLVNMPAEKPADDSFSNEESLLLKILDYEPMLIDELDTPWPMDKLLQLLVTLEIKGMVVGEQGYFSRVA
ncbi:MAG: DNA-processing protein DprA [Porticoccaceae bacterium]|nr:DNA-processing protein DprA [Porticoccaceae bacterium]